MTCCLGTTDVYWCTFRGVGLDHQAVKSQKKKATDYRAYVTLLPATAVCWIFSVASRLSGHRSRVFLLYRVCCGILCTAAHRGCYEFEQRQSAQALLCCTQNAPQIQTLCSASSVVQRRSALPFSFPQTPSFLYANAAEPGNLLLKEFALKFLPRQGCDVGI